MRCSENHIALAVVCAISLCKLAAGAELAGVSEPRPLAIFAAKALTASRNGPQVVAPAMVLVQDGRIAAIGAPAEVPAGYERVDLGELWLAPGFVDLHCHVAGTLGDINDMVYQLNPELRASCTVVPGNDSLRLALAAGVTTVLYIPGSGTNIGGQGVLLKTAPTTYEAALVRDPGSLKIAQGDNPTRWGYGMGRVFMNWHLRDKIEQGLAYVGSWEQHAAGLQPAPERDLSLDIFRALKAKRTQVSTHTQSYQLVMMTIRMLAVDYGFAVYIDHGEFLSSRNSKRAVAAGVAGIFGPREIDWPSPPRLDTDGQARGVAWGYQQEGMQEIGFNTDAPVVPAEELPLQAALSVRYGLRNDELQSVRGLTCVPARAAGLEAQLGSIEVGKDADLIVVDGDPADPRTTVSRVYVAGSLAYDNAQGRLW